MIYGVEKSKIRICPYCKGIDVYSIKSTKSNGGFGKTKNRRHDIKKNKTSPNHFLHGRIIHGFWDTYTKKITLGTFSIPNIFKVPSDFSF